MSKSAKKKTQVKGVIMLLAAAFIWGLTFVVQSVGSENLEGFTFNGIRTVIGALALLPFVLIRDKAAVQDMNTSQLIMWRKSNKKTVIYGVAIGVAFCIATNFQQFAFYDSTSGKIAFITALYMCFVPILGLFFKQKTPLLTWFCVLLGFVGLFLLCIDFGGGVNINKGDVLALIGSFFFAVHILLIERFAPTVDGIKLSCIQFATSGIISCVLMFIFEKPQIGAIQGAIVLILYAGLMNCGLGVTLQIIGQKYTEATLASLVLCMESVFAVLCSALFLHEVLSPQETIGCVVMFVAIILAQLSGSITKKREENKLHKKGV